MNLHVTSCIYRYQLIVVVPVSSWVAAEAGLDAKPAKMFNDIKQAQK